MPAEAEECVELRQTLHPNSVLWGTLERWAKAAATVGCGAVER